MAGFQSDYLRRTNARGAYADLLAGNPAMKAGEFIVEHDTGRAKVGDNTGTKKWNDQGYLYEGINVKSCGAKGDGSTDDSAAFLAAINIAVSTGVPIIIPSGSYKLSAQGQALGGNHFYQQTSGNIYIYGHGFPKILMTTSTLETDPFTFILKNGVNSGELYCNGVYFVGSNDDDLNTNTANVFYSYQGATDIRIENCRFNQVSPLAAASYTTAHQTYFLDNIIKNAPNAIVVGHNAVVRGNHFVNDSYVSTRSHAIYQYGGFDKFIVTQNFFKNITKFGLKIKGNNADKNQKSGFIVTNNIFVDGRSAAVEIGTLSEVNNYDFVIKDNIIINNKDGIQLYNGSRGIVKDNIFTRDIFTPDDIGVSTGIFISGTANTKNSDGANEGVSISDNVVTNQALWVTSFQFAGQPNVGDTIALGTETYTFVSGTESNSNEIQIQSTDVDTYKRFVYKIQGLGGVKPYFINRSEDVVYDKYDNTVYINANQSISVTNNLTNTTLIKNNVDYTGLIDTAISTKQCYETIVIENNIIKRSAGGIGLNGCMAPIVRHNTFIGLNSYLYAISAIHCPHIDVYGNKYRDIIPYSSPGRRLFLQSPFVTEYNNDFPYNLTDQSYQDIKYLLGSGGSGMPLGDGKAFNWFYYGDDTQLTQGDHDKYFTWQDGDTVQLSIDGGSTFKYTFTFKVSTPGVNEFSSRAELMALINATTEFEAVDYELTSIDYFWFKIRAVSVGTTGNNYVVKTNSLANKFVGLYFNNGQFVGGSVSPDTTVIFTKRATNRSLPVLTAQNSEAATIMNSLYVSKIVAGEYYELKHGNATGNELFSWR